MKTTFKIIIAVATLVIIFIVYTLFTGEEAGTDVVLVEEDFSAQVEVENIEFLRILNSLEGVTLNTDLFATPAFISLFDFSVTLVPKPQGRDNPFLPFENVGSSDDSGLGRDTFD